MRIQYIYIYTASSDLSLHHEQRYGNIFIEPKNRAVWFFDAFFTLFLTHIYAHTLRFSALVSSSSFLQILPFNRLCIDWSWFVTL